MKKLKRIDNGELFSIMTHMFELGKTFSFAVKGSSMYPFLKEDIDQVVVMACNLRDISRWDIVLFQREDGQYVLHRVIRLEGKEIYVNGDAQMMEEGPIAIENVLAKVVSVKRYGKILDTSSISYRRKVKLWHTLKRYRRVLIKVFKIMERRDRGRQYES